MTTYHILNGDCLAEQLRQTKINQNFIVCRECFIDGNLYADNITDSMQKTIDETARRRSIQLKYNADHGITPKQIVKAITSALPTSKEEGAKIVPMGAEGSKPRVYVEPESAAFVADPIVRSMSKEELEKSIANTTALMKQAAKDLDFMQAAQYRDEIIRLQKELEEKG